MIIAIGLFIFAFICFAIMMVLIYQGINMTSGYTSVETDEDRKRRHDEELFIVGMAIVACM